MEVPPPEGDVSEMGSADFAALVLARERRQRREEELRRAAVAALLHTHRHHQHHQQQQQQQQQQGAAAVFSSDESGEEEEGVLEMPTPEEIRDGPEARFSTVLMRNCKIVLYHKKNCPMQDPPLAVEPTFPLHFWDAAQGCQGQIHDVNKWDSQMHK